MHHRAGFARDGVGDLEGRKRLKGHAHDLFKPYSGIVRSPFFEIAIDGSEFVARNQVLSASIDRHALRCGETSSEFDAFSLVEGGPFGRTTEWQLMLDQPGFEQIKLPLQCKAVVEV